MHVSCHQEILMNRANIIIQYVHSSILSIHFEIIFFTYYHMKCTFSLSYILVQPSRESVLFMNVSGLVWLSGPVIHE